MDATRFLFTDRIRAETARIARGLSRAARRESESDTSSRGPDLLAWAAPPATTHQTGQHESIRINARSSVSTVPAHVTSELNISSPDARQPSKIIAPVPATPFF